ncbi:pantetheine-phosphate adenylyltransferase [Tepidimonas taiwanensis]|uniref:Phosphopantetheine adenylyltransferase n=1 Tax=Tepidimonas taiwanensis TaxID=307486 RepID=A0A554X523_9BURK|nr:pantetheine-phosphate adenylyltransferase [Tepidimonas taiwanensis]MDM7464163.1 pantetheine-phosphate adenylyltransferase [Tepidimonas taiwanensis]TSE30925.1 Phosphopantetheine adenylyltransferase [Tepidimonas taiwanensis]UBQ05861.1 pantetheine-phosphate adenylyltransferase [Tepidimonas taiwanensis]
MSNASAPRVAVYSGTFDPITLGHEDVIRRAAGLFDRLIVAVAVAHHKKTLFSLDERLAMVTEALADCPAVQVLPFEGLIMDFCRAHGAVAVVRGIRNMTDFDYEAQMAAMNARLLPTVETLFLLPRPTVQCISSTLVREIAKLGGDVGGMVGPGVAQRLRAAFPAAQR